MNRKKGEKILAPFEETAMSKPSICFSMEADGALRVTHHVDALNEPFAYNMDLQAMNAAGLKVSCRHLGLVILRLMNQWNPGAFETYPNLQVRLPKPPDPRDRRLLRTPHGYKTAELLRQVARQAESKADEDLEN